MAQQRTKDENEDEEATAGSAADASGSLGLVGALVRGARLEPIRFVERELTHPDGTKLRVKVPVYPPFRLEDRPSAASSPPDARSQRAPARRKAS